MANSRFEYVKKFELNDELMPETWLVVRIDGRGFARFTSDHGFSKPNDEAGCALMDEAARAVMREWQEISLAYGHSDEYSFLLPPKAKLFKRRASKIQSCFVSVFTANYIFHWPRHFPFTPLRSPPTFDARAVPYPTARHIRDYFSWRQADAHINSLYNACFWALVTGGDGSRSGGGGGGGRGGGGESGNKGSGAGGGDGGNGAGGDDGGNGDDGDGARAGGERNVGSGGRARGETRSAGGENNSVSGGRRNDNGGNSGGRGGMTAAEAQQRLKGTVSGQKHELLFSEYGINYNHLPTRHRRGTVLVRRLPPPHAGGGTKRHRRKAAGSVGGGSSGAGGGENEDHGSADSGGHVEPDIASTSCQENARGSPPGDDTGLNGRAGGSGSTGSGEGSADGVGDGSLAKLERETWRGRGKGGRGDGGKRSGSDAVVGSAGAGVVARQVASPEDPTELVAEADDLETLHVDIIRALFWEERSHLLVEE